MSVYLQRVRCGEYFSVAATSKNVVLFWGTKVTSSVSTEDVNSCRSGTTTTTNLCGSGDVCLDGADLTGGACGGTTSCGAARSAGSECEGASAGGLTWFLVGLYTTSLLIML